MTGNLLEDWRDEWDLTLRNGRLSEETRVVYYRSVTQFLDWVHELDPEIADPEHLNRRHGDGWLGHLTNTVKMAGATRRVRLIAVRAWLEYIVEQPDSNLVVNPFAKIPLPIPDDKLVPIIPDEELTALLNTCKGTDFISLRDTAIIRTLLDTGARRAELVGVDVEDLDLHQQEVTVTGKGSKVRILPLSPKTVLALRKYLRARARRPAATAKPLFLSIRPGDRGQWRLTGGGVGEMITRRCKLAGLKHRWPHQLRHTWAHDLLDNGANEGDVERLGGWAPGSKMVKRYGAAMADARARKRSRGMARGDRV